LLFTKENDIMRLSLPPGVTMDTPRNVARNINVLKPGPKTPKGKAIASRNSLRHGLTARTVVLAEESQAEFDALLANISSDRNPVGELEIQLTGEIAACMWRLARARQHESTLLEVTTNVYRQEPGKLELIMRYVRFYRAPTQPLHRTPRVPSDPAPQKRRIPIRFANR
jgi:hypothetical protein